MIIGKRYNDSMDPSRQVEPVSSDGTCRIYFDNIYCGNAHVPVGLFNLANDWLAERIGFLPALSAEQLAEQDAANADDDYQEGDNYAPRW